MPKTEKIRSMFDSIAPSYDSLNHLFSLGVDKSWRRRSLRYVFGPRVLDIACGTGDYSVDIARRVDGAAVTGLDLSEGMLEVMRTKVSKLGLSDKISTMQGDCTHMPFEDGAFDCVTIGFGIRNFEDRPACLREILRVLRPGGRLVILELSVPENRVLRWLYCLYFQHIMPVVGGWISGDRAAYRYLPASVLAFPPREEWMGIMKDAGYTRVQHRAFTFGLCRMYIGEK